MIFVAGLCLEGLVAPWCLDAPMNGRAFLLMWKFSPALCSSPAISSPATTWEAIGRIIETIRPQECRNYFANSGYVSN